MTVRQRILVIGFFIVTILGNLWNVYHVQQNVVTLFSGSQTTVYAKNSEEIAVADDLEADSHELFEQVTLAHNADGTEHDLANCKLLHINWAPSSQLVELPGIGPVLAGNIIVARQEDYFVELTDVLRTKGIGEKKLAQLAEFICLAVPDDKY